MKKTLMYILAVLLVFVMTAEMVYAEDDEQTYRVSCYYRVWDQWQECTDGNLVREKSFTDYYCVGDEVYLPALTQATYFRVSGYPSEVLWGLAYIELLGGGNPEDLGAIYEHPNYRIPSMIPEEVDLTYNYGPIYDMTYDRVWLENESGEYELSEESTKYSFIGDSYSTEPTEIEGYEFNAELSTLSFDLTLRTAEDPMFGFDKYYDLIEEEEPETPEEPVVDPDDPVVDPDDPETPDDPGDEPEDVIPEDDPEPGETVEPSDEPVEPSDEPSKIPENKPEKVVTTGPEVATTIKTNYIERHEELPQITEEKKAEPDTIIEVVAPKTSAEPDEVKTWALINLIFMVCTALALLKLSNKKYNLISIVLAVASILLFVFTEHTCYQMVWYDGWTIWMIFLYIGEVVSRYLSKEKDEPEDEVIRL